MLVALPLALAPVLQQVRPPVELAPASTGGAVRLASAGDRSAALRTAGGSTELVLSTSDGRGLAWGPELVVDDAPPGAFLGGTSVHVDGDQVLIGWWDDRHYDPGLWPIVAATFFVRSYDDAAGVLGPVVQVPTGTPLDRTQIPGSAMTVERVGAELRVHVLLAIQVTPASGPATLQVLLFTSNDGGQSFAPPLPVTAPLPPSGSFAQAFVSAEGDVVHAAWVYNAGINDEQVYYQRSSDGGATLDFAAPEQLTSGPLAYNVDFDARGATLAFAYERLVVDFAYADMAVLVSTDGGTTFSVPAVLPAGDPFLVGVGEDPSVAVAEGGAVVVGWKDLHTGEQQVYAARSTDGGATWSPPEQLSTSQGRYPALRAAGPGRERVVATWTESIGGVRNPMAAVSYDAGASFTDGVALDDLKVGPFVTVPTAFNDDYQNVLASWSGDDAPMPVYVGGLRPQFVTPTGFSPGSTAVGAQLDGFDDGSPLGFVLFSTAPGDLFLPFGDGRNLGLAATPLFTTSVNLVGAGVLATPLAPDGSGALATVTTPPLSSPFTVFSAALSFDLGTLAFGDVSDVVAIDF